MVAGLLELDILLEERAWERAVPDTGDVCRRAAAAAWAAFQAANAGPWPDPTTACLLLTSDERMRALNRQFRGRDEPTNVLSFSAVEADVLAAAGADGPPPELGDIVIALQTALADAACDGKQPGDHLSHLVVHGMLHLLGYDHENDDDAEEMEALEVRILANLGIADPYGPRDQPQK